MNSNQLFFHIHYCNGRTWKHPRRLSRTLSHHALVLVTRGGGRITIGGTTTAIQGGMLYYIAPGVFHSVEPGGEESAGFLTVHFSCSRIILNDRGWEVTDENPEIPLEPILSIKDAHSVLDFFHRLVDCWLAKLPGYEFMSKILLQQLFVAIYQHIKQQHAPDAVSLKVEKVIHYMHQHVKGKITLGELAETVQLSPAYLSRTFKENTGYSVIGFFNKLKIDKAKELLLEGDLKVKEVAGELGFSDEFYFSRMFKKIEGVSPSEFYSKIVHGH
ncbi:AraC family transcriptional regulator [Paenibacillus sp. XY044]|uniref:helix-turn-helix transcriptional regulator n=1 Tax=Paenibacillus sp. XY044 TaxID=2026089 RepID=UPI000B98CB62|nr:AraC family transcriptional regulator [Paenibacillus sp. XY044]OZB98841.1 AraC family transcriptional regulator [Paenibacillus sp. XY044]